jgi:ABC-type iron transport system FetAB ATPase subunit
MEALFANTQDSLNTKELCKKILRKHWKQIDRDEIIALLRKGKYHSSINKLYYLARALDDGHANHIMSIIKRYSYRISV